MTDYSSVYARATADTGAFWLEASGMIDWVIPPKTALDSSVPPFIAGFQALN